MRERFTAVRSSRKKGIRMLRSCLLRCVLRCSSSPFAAQNCARNTGMSDKMICVSHRYLGQKRLDSACRPSEFQNNFCRHSLAPLNSAIARQSVLLPWPPPIGNYVSWNSATKIFISSTDSLGPIYAERAETIGQAQVLVALPIST